MLSHRLRRLVVMTCAGLAQPGIGLADNRTFNGSGNNLTNTEWGSTGEMLLRMGGAAYGDGISSMGGVGRANPRVISNAIFHQSASMLNSRGLTDWVWQWGQFLDHDLDLVGRAEPVEAAPITVPAGDPFFAPGTTISFNRSEFAPGTGTSLGNPRQQVNTITSWIDGSQVYGSSQTDADSLRTFSGGRLSATSHASGELLPMSQGMFVAGDGRVNEQIGLTAAHTLFMREHNRWAGVIASQNPGWSDEEVYQRARKIVGAEIQHITYHEWLPALTGSALPAYGGYQTGVDPTIANEFATALFRVGHTMLSPTLLRLNDDGSVIGAGNVALRDAFFSPNRILNEGGVDPLLKGLASQQMQEVDSKVVSDVRNFLFTIPTGGMDLVSLNIQRGRDHGLADYNSVRVALGLAGVTSFAQITSDTALASTLESLYGDVNNIDLWVGALSEDRLAGSSLGELLTAGILHQFKVLRSCDRFWHQSDADLVDVLAQIEDTTLSDIIMANSSISTLQDNVFFIPTPGAGTAAILGLWTLASRRRRG